MKCIAKELLHNREGFCNKNNNMGCTMHNAHAQTQLISQLEHNESVKENIYR